MKEREEFKQKIILQLIEKYGLPYLEEKDLVAIHCGGIIEAAELLVAMLYGQEK